MRPAGRVQRGEGIRRATERPGPGDPVEDEELVSRIAGGDLAAFAAIYDRYSQRIHAWSAHVLGAQRAEDAMQEIFLRLWLHAGQFDSDRGTFTSWFTAVARHHLVHVLRQDGTRKRLTAAADVSAVLAGVSSPHPGPEETVGRHEDAATLARALRLLPEEQRQAVVLAYFGGLSQSQIAEQLALPLGTVKKRIRLAMAKLHDALAPGRSASGVPIEDARGAPRTTE
jgi:RNA polymerase sigma-70 factor (ECF subfamily)